MATGPGRARAGLVAMEPGQEAAGDSLGSSIEGLASGDDGLEASGDDGLDASGLVTGAVVGRVVVELAPGLLHAAIAPSTSHAMMLIWTSIPVGGPRWSVDTRTVVRSRLRPGNVHAHSPNSGLSADRPAGGDEEPFDHLVGWDHLPAASATGFSRPPRRAT